VPSQKVGVRAMRRLIRNVCKALTVETIV